MEKFYKEYNKNNDYVAILGVYSSNLGRERNKGYIEKFLNEEEHTFPVVVDEGRSLVYQYGISAFSSNLIGIGVIIQYFAKFQKDSSTVTWLNEVLK